MKTIASKERAVGYLLWHWTWYVKNVKWVNDGCS